LRIIALNEDLSESEAKIKINAESLLSMRQKIDELQLTKERFQQEFFDLHMHYRNL